MERIKRLFKDETNPWPDKWPSEPSEAYSDDGGKTWRWSSNNSVILLDVCQSHHIPCDVTAQQAARDAYVTDMLSAYRQRQTQRSPAQVAEEMAEARAAHGPGVELVNVVTGERYTT